MCFKVIRLTSEFLRDAEKHAKEPAGVSGRKMTFMNATCDELRSRSDAQLDAFMALLPGPFRDDDHSFSPVASLKLITSKKRKLEVAGLDSEDPGTRHAIINRRAAALEGANRRGAHDQPPPHSRLIDTDPAAQAQPMTHPLSVLPPPSHTVGITSTYADMSHPMEAQPTPDIFDAPILHIMNSVPMNAWTTVSHETANPVHEVLGTDDGNQVHRDPSGTYDAPILRIMNGIPVWGAESQSGAI